jgi:hypothetical protein
VGLLIVKADFVNYFALAQSQSDRIDPFISQYEESYLIDLLGPELFKLFKADVNVTTRIPDTALYEKLYDPFLEEIDGCKYVNRGMKSMLLGFIWWDYVRENDFKQTDSGTKVNDSELSKGADSTSYYLYKRYNESIADYNVIQAYARKNSDVYPLFKGECKEIAWFI